MDKKEFLELAKKIAKATYNYRLKQDESHMQLKTIGCVEGKVSIVGLAQYIFENYDGSANIHIYAGEKARLFHPIVSDWENPELAKIEFVDPKDHMKKTLEVWSEHGEVSEFTDLYLDYDKDERSVDIMKDIVGLYGGIVKDVFKIGGVLTEVEKEDAEFYAVRKREKVFDEMSIEEKMDIVRDVNTSAEEIRRFAEDMCGFIRMDCAWHPNAPEDVLRKLARDDWEFVRRDVALNENCPRDVLEMLCHDEHDQVAKAAIGQWKERFGFRTLDSKISQARKKRENNQFQENVQNEKMKCHKKENDYQM